MKHTFKLILLLSLLFSCSKDNVNEETPDSVNPLNQTINEKLYAYKAYDKIVEVNPIDGSQVSDIATLGSDYFSNIVYSKTSNELIGLQISFNGTNNNYDFVRVNLSTGQVTRSILQAYESFVMTDSGKLYAYKAYDKIVELNPTDGSEIADIATLGSDYFSKIVYSKTSNELIGLQSYGGLNNYYDFVRVDISTGQVIRSILQGYESFFMTDSGKLYAYRADDKIVELNPTDGSEIADIATLGSDYFSNIVYSESSKELIGSQSSFNGTTNTYDFVRVNTMTGEITKTVSEHIENLIIGE